MQALEDEIAQLIIEATGLEDVNPGDIDPQASLFGEGLGLDSIDALEIGLALHRKYGVKLSADTAETRKHFASLRSLAQLIEASRAEVS